jgi:cyclophilin family peptidyl-prolyl cis-trans isomerase
MPSATIHTTKGDIDVQLFADDAPKAANNFLDLARKGFYDGVIFHRIVPGFVIQGGDPTGTGRGGPGYQFADEPFKGDYDRGTLAMANAGPNTNGSQFFICLADLGGRLPKSYTIFGRGTKGMDVVDAIAAGPTGANDRPHDPVSMTAIDVADD